MEINFYNFKKLMNLSTQMDIHLDGIKLKPSATSTVSEEIEEDGVKSNEIFETNLNEIKDERVNFLYDTTINVPIPNTTPPPDKINSFRVMGTEVTDLYDSNDNELIKYPADGPATLSVDSINIPIRPAHEFMQNDAFPETSRSVLVDRIWLAACGFWDSKNLKLNKFVVTGDSDTGIQAPEVDTMLPGQVLSDDIGGNLVTARGDNKDAPWMNIKTFKRRLKLVKEKLVPRGVDVLVTIYERSVDVFGNDINSTGVSRRRTRNYAQVKPLMNAFIAKRSDPASTIPATLLPLEPNNISPFDISIQSLQNIIGDDGETLFSDLIDIMNDVDDSMNLTDSGNYIDADVSNSQLIDKLRNLQTRISNTQASNSNSLDGFQISDFKSNVKQLNDLLERIKWFEYFNGVSVNNFVNSIITGNIIRKRRTYRKLARILVPVDLGIKVTKVRRKPLISGGGYAGRLFRKLRRYRYVRTDLGIRFAEIRFVDTSVLQKYRKNETPSGFPQVDGNGNPIMITNPITGEQEQQVIDFPVTNPDPIPTDMTVDYEIPHLPFDPDLRKLALDSFGFFDHSKNSNIPNIYDVNGTLIFDADSKKVVADVYDAFGNLVLPQNSDITDGYKAFLDTSKNINDLRSGVDIYNKAQFLLAILQSEYGEHRVKLIETTRSLDDQNKIQLGGPSSNMLSWHNYGLAVKILITDDSGLNTIKEGSDDHLKLIDIAEAFTNACYAGYIGCPMNIVWCGRLKTGPDNFVWEFLPIGVEHKDAPKFRDSLYNQIDPVVDNAFVDVLNINRDCSVEAIAVQTPVVDVGFVPIITQQPSSQSVTIIPVQITFPPVITVSPFSGSYSLGSALILSISYTPGNPSATTFVWKKDNVVLSNGGRISGANSDTLTITDFESGDVGGYTCTVSNEIGSNESDVANITESLPNIFDAPDFFRSDFNVSSGSDLEVDFGNPSIVGFVGTVDSESIYRSVSIFNGFNAEVTYITGHEESDTFNHDHYRIQGCGISEGGFEPFVNNFPAVTFYAEDGDGLNNNRFRIIDHNDVALYQSSGTYDANIPYTVTVNFEVTPADIDGYHDLSIRLRVPSLGIDETRTILQWTQNSGVNFGVFGPFYTDHNPRMILTSYHTEEGT